MYPRLLIDLDKLEHNAKTLVEMAAKYGIEVAGVTKVFCAHRDIARAFVKGGVKYLADSRIENMKALQEFNIPKIFLRLPMLSQVDQVVKYSHISLNSEIEVIKALSAAAQRQGRVHSIILMVDLGDLREGIYKEEELCSTVEKILALKGVELIGLGTNLTCYGGVIPDKDNLGRLIALAEKIEKRFHIKLKLISGGNSSTIHLLGQEDLRGINHLRLGESIVLGYETAYGKRIGGTFDDAFLLEAELVEIREKPSVPQGKIGMDAFGNTPHLIDRGIRRRAICAIGKQDMDDEDLIPIDPGIIVLGASSDHLIIDINDSKKEYRLGDKIQFKLRYSSLLRAMTSKYVKKVIVKA